MNTELKRIVVVYEVDGDCECSGHTEIIRVKYDSPEAFLVHFEERLKACRAAWEEGCRAKEKWRDERPKDIHPRGHKDIDKRRAEANKLNEERTRQWLLKQPPLPQVSFEVGGHEFYFWNFYLRSNLWDANYSDDYKLPEVYELGEWFDRGFA